MLQAREGGQGHTRANPHQFQREGYTAMTTCPGHPPPRAVGGKSSSPESRTPPLLPDTVPHLAPVQAGGSGCALSRSSYREAESSPACPHRCFPKTAALELRAKSLPVTCPSPAAYSSSGRSVHPASCPASSAAGPSWRGPGTCPWFHCRRRGFPPG